MFYYTRNERHILDCSLALLVANNEGQPRKKSIICHEKHNYSAIDGWRINSIQLLLVRQTILCLI
jgi:hypothetical protein